MPDVTNDGVRDDEERTDETDTRARDRNRPATDTGHTAGGGSLGHDQPEEVTRETPTRNAADPVMPSDDSALNTKI